MEDAVQQHFKVPTPEVKDVERELAKPFHMIIREKKEGRKFVLKAKWTPASTVRGFTLDQG